MMLCGCANSMPPLNSGQEKRNEKMTSRIGSDCLQRGVSVDCSVNLYNLCVS